jgi:hypothetical protein
MSEPRRTASSRHLSLAAGQHPATGHRPSPVRAAIVALALGCCIMVALAWSTVPVRSRAVTTLGATTFVQP